MSGRRFWRQWLAGSLSGSMLLLTGCGDFFNKGTGGNTGGGGNVGSYLYVGTQTGSLGSYSVSTTGALAALGGSPVQLSTSAINALAVNPSNSLLYAAVAGAGVYGLSIATNGVATLINTSALVQDVSPLAMTLDPSGSFVLVAGLYNGGAAVGEYTINSDGTLAEVQGSPIAIALPSGTDATNLTVQNVVVAPNSSYVFVSLGQLGVAALPFSTGGALSANTNLITPKTTANISNQDIGLAVDPSSKFLFIGETNVGVRVATIAANSSFSEIGGSPFKAGGQPRYITLDGTGGYVYVANATDNTISGYSLQANGGLTALTGSPFSSVGSLPYALALDQSKKYLIETNVGVSNSSNVNVQVYSFDATTAGKLNPGATVTNLPAAGAIATTH